MKKFIFFALAAVACFSANAQIDAQHPDTLRQRMSREELTAAQANYIASELKLDEETTAKFIASFTAYQKEIWSLVPVMGPKRGHRDGFNHGNGNGPKEGFKDGHKDGHKDGRKEHMNGDKENHGHNGKHNHDKQKPEADQVQENTPPTPGEGPSMESRFERRRQVLDIQEKFYNECRGFLSEEQVEQLFNMEKKHFENMSKRHGDRHHKGGNNPFNRGHKGQHGHGHHGNFDKNADNGNAQTETAE